MPLKFQVGNPGSVASGGRPNILRAADGVHDDGAVRTCGRLDLAYATWTNEVWFRLERQPRQSGVFLPLAVLACNNGEVQIESDGGGGLQAKAYYRVKDTNGNEVVYTLGPWTVTADNTWHLWTQQFSLPNTRGCVWVDGVVKAASTALTSSGNAIYVKRTYIGYGMYLGAEAVVDTGSTPGLFGLDNARFSPSERYPHNTAFSPPTAQFNDTPATARFVWKMRDAALPHHIASLFSTVWGIPRLSAFANRYPGPWAVTPNGYSDPVP